MSEEPEPTYDHKPQVQVIYTIVNIPFNSDATELKPDKTKEARKTFREFTTPRRKRYQ